MAPLVSRGTDAAPSREPAQQATCHAAGTIPAEPRTATPFHHTNICSAVGGVDPLAPAPPRDAGRQAILNDTRARVPVIIEGDTFREIDPETGETLCEGSVVRVREPVGETN